MRVLKAKLCFLDFLIFRQIFFPVMVSNNLLESCNFQDKKIEIMDFTFLKRFLSLIVAACLLSTLTVPLLQALNILQLQHVFRQNFNIENATQAVNNIVATYFICLPGYPGKCLKFNLIQNVVYRNQTDSQKPRNVAHNQ